MPTPSSMQAIALGRTISTMLWAARLWQWHRAESAFNLAKCYRALKDTDKELEYLNKAYPVFDKYYTAEAEKTRQAKERIEELTK